MVCRVNSWESEIVKGVLIQQRIEELDRGRLWTRYLPEVAAGEDKLQETEKRLGFSLDPEYRDFLRHADGWRCFFHAVDLFGTQNLLGAPPMERARAQLRAVGSEDLLAATGMNLEDVLPIGASPLQPDMFLLALPRSASPGAVIWFTGQEIDRFPCFDDFYGAMLDYSREEVRFLEAELPADAAVKPTTP